MFTQNVPITEALDIHLNSSSDSHSSEEKSNKEEENVKYLPPTLDDIKFKQERYSNYKRKIIFRKKELEGDKEGTMWKTLYYTFFINNKNNTTTLSELELRTKFLFNMDKLEVTDNIRDKEKKNKTPPIIEIEKFIKHFREKKEDNLLVKIFHKKRSASEKKIKKQEPILKLGEDDEVTRIVVEKNDNEKTIGSNLGTSSNNKEIYGIKQSLTPPKNRTMYFKSLLELNDFKDNNDLVYAIKKLQIDYQKKKKNKDKNYEENLSNILQNNNVFKKELDSFQKTASRVNQKIKAKIQNILDIESSKQFFLKQKETNLIHNFDGDLEPQNRMSRQINNLYNKILTKLNPRFKINYN